MSPHPFFLNKSVYTFRAISDIYMQVFFGNKITASTQNSESYDLNHVWAGKSYLSQFQGNSWELLTSEGAYKAPRIWGKRTYPEYSTIPCTALENSTNNTWLTGKDHTCLAYKTQAISMSSSILYLLVVHYFPSTH